MENGFFKYYSLVSNQAEVNGRNRLTKKPNPEKIIKNTISISEKPEKLGSHFQDLQISELPKAFKKLI